MTVPLALAALALVDACFAGFRAATGRNARIRKRAYHLLAARRGLVVGVAALALAAVPLVLGLVTAADPAARYGDLVHAGTRMLQVLLPYAGVVVLSLAAYWLLPMRESTFIILVGLGPLTLLRPAVVVAAVVWASMGSTDWLVWTGAATTAAGVLAVGPISHHRWYRTPF